MEPETNDSQFISVVTAVDCHGVQRRMISVDNFFSYFRIFEIIMFCFVVATFDLVHDVETIFHLSYVLTASGFFLKYE